MVVDNGVVELGSGDQVIAVLIEGADELPELLATAPNGLGVGDLTRPVGITNGHNIVDVLLIVVAFERLSALNSGDFLGLGSSLRLEDAEEVAFGSGDGDESDDNEGSDFLEHIYYFNLL